MNSMHHLFLCILFSLQKMVSHGEHTHLYSQLLMHILAQENKGGSNIRRLCQEVHRNARERLVKGDLTELIVQWCQKTFYALLSTMGHQHSSLWQLFSTSFVKPASR